jgi:hypothetical protein
MREYKVLFAGAMGSGKTTAITQISEIAPGSTEAVNTDRASCDKSHTTVALDYGEMTLDGGDKLRLYGTPGQARFDFMWSILGQGALGVILLVDHSRPDPFADLRDYATRFSAVIHGSSAVVGVGRIANEDEGAIGRYLDVLDDLGMQLPVFSVDVRRRDDVSLLLEALLFQIEAGLSEMEFPGELPHE